MRIPDAPVRMKALARLIVATQAPEAAPATYQVYLENTVEYSTDTFVTACRRLEPEAKWFPKVSELRAACTEVLTEQARLRDEQTRQRQLEAAAAIDPISNERHQAFLAMIRSAIGKKAM